jgi:hypothetical protein
MKNIKYLAIAKALKYLIGALYLIGFLFALAGNYVIFILLAILSLIGYIASCVFDLIFVVKELKKK